MATQVQLRRGTEAENNNFTGAEGEITIDTTNDTIRVHDGVKRGGYKVMKGNDPIVAGAYPVISYDEKGLVTGGRQLKIDDLPTSDLDKSYAKKTSVSEGAYTKITIDKEGVISKAETITSADVPSLPISKTQGLQEALDNKARKILVAKKENVSSVINLVEGSLNVITVEGSSDLQPPVITSADAGELRQILVQLDNSQGHTVRLVAAKGFGDTPVPTITDAGFYNVYFEYNVKQGAWICGAIKV